MLQQTQVERVIPKYRAFIRAYPTVQALAHAQFRDVLLLWRGLGYNRRARALHESARIIVSRHNGRVPGDMDTLRTLPGIGSYTAGAVCAFAYNKAYVILETNIRTVLIHHLLPHHASVSESELQALAAELLDIKNPREWYWALMDYGAYLKSSGVRTNNRMHHYKPQARFKGSLREVRGALLREISDAQQIKQKALTLRLPFTKARTQQALASLVRDGLVVLRGETVRLP